MGVKQSRSKKKGKSKGAIVNITGVSQVGKKTLMKSISHIYQIHSSDFNEDRIWQVYSLARFMNVAITMNVRWIVQSDEHGDCYWRMSEKIRELGKATEVTTKSSPISRERRILMLDLVKQIWDGWPRFNEICDLHTHTYEDTMGCVWWYRRLWDPQIRDFLLSDDDDASIDGSTGMRHIDKHLDLYLRCCGHSRIEDPLSLTIRNQSSVIVKGLDIASLLNYFAREECGLCDGYMYSDLCEMISDFYGVSMDHRFDQYIIKHDPSNVELYTWQIQRNIDIDPIKKPNSMHLCVYVTSLVNCARKSTVFKSDLHYFDKLCAKIFGYYPLKCVLLLTNKDTLKEMIREGNIDMFENMPVEYKGPSFTEIQDCTVIDMNESQWLDFCVNQVIQHITSIFMSFENAKQCVSKIVTLNTLDLKQLAQGLLNQDVYDLIDTCKSDLELG